MGEHACFGSGNQGQGSLDAGHDPVATATTHTIAARTVGEAPHIAWLSARSECWPPRGDWAMPAGAAGDGSRVAAEAGAFFSSASLPATWYAAVAVPGGAMPAGQSAALGLVGALRGRRDSLCRRLTVVVMAENPSSLDGAFVRRLLDVGAFVMLAGLDATGDHLHHFPLRAPMLPRRGRLVCVDLADWLHTWRPGRVADLHAIPTGFADTARSLRRLPVPDGGARALNLVFYLDRDAPGGPLREMDRLADHCHDLFLRPDGDAVFTDADRLDGRTGSADLLVIHEATTGG